MSLRLLADCGNSTIKLALDRGDDEELRDVTRCDTDAEALEQALAEHEAPGELILIGVSESKLRFVEDWWRRTRPLQPVRRLDRELPLPSVGQYEGCGHDRVLAGIAAGRELAGEVLVVDAGTATTLSAWRWDPGKRAGVAFAGGLILPGARACSQGLAQAAPALPEVEPIVGEPNPCQFDTQGAIAAGLGIGYPAMVAECLRKLQQQTGIDALRLTGGNAAILIDRVIAAEHLRPALVLDGLARWLRIIAA